MFVEVIDVFNVNLFGILNVRLKGFYIYYLYEVIVVIVYFFFFCICMLEYIYK